MRRWEAGIYHEARTVGIVDRINFGSKHCWNELFGSLVPRHQVYIVRHLLYLQRHVVDRAASCELRNCELGGQK